MKPAHKDLKAIEVKLEQRLAEMQVKLAALQSTIDTSYETAKKGEDLIEVNNY